MKKTLFVLGMVFSSVVSMAQNVASDFTQTDINGTTHNLYTYLDAGKVVIVDMSATWCGPCWDFHQAHYLKDLNAQFGPNGTNEVVIIFYEDDVNTPLADLNGTGGGMGDWVTGVDYPIINATAGLPAEYGSGYPTVSVICPSDKKIKDNLFNYNDINAMKAAVQTVINDCTTPSTASIDLVEKQEVNVAPNPTKGEVTVKFSSSVALNSIVNVYGVTGAVVQTYNQLVVSGENTLKVNLSTLENGTYFIQLINGDKESEMIQVVKN